MSLSAKLQQRQTQSLVMTPQLAQSIKLLQFGHAELLDFVRDEVEKNPLLEMSSETTGSHQDIDANADAPGNNTAGTEPSSVDRIDGLIANGSVSQPQSSVENTYDTGTAGAEKQALETNSTFVDSFQVSGASSSSEAGEQDFISQIGESVSLVQHLEKQISMEFRNPEEKLIATYIAHGLDQDGYFRESLTEVASSNETTVDMVQWVLDRFQGFEPVGIGARDLAECLTLQLKDKNRFDPAMQTLLENIDMLAKHQFKALKKLCDVTTEDFNEMLSEIRALDPRPARGFEPVLAEIVVPDVLISQTHSGGWNIELNPETLPKVLIDREYHLELSSVLDDAEGKSFVTDCLENANWLLKSLDQRAHTILKVASEIVKRQDRFFADGTEYLKPLTLKQVAEKIGMHESTVSRVTANKYLICDQGTFELKYFFSSAIASSDGETSISAEAVKYQIQQLVNSEDPAKILSDEQIVANLQDAGIAIARRTVAKYREALHIPSSVERRRQKTNSL